MFILWLTNEDMGRGKKIKGAGIPELFFERLLTIVGPSLFHDVQKTFVERLTTFRVNILKNNEQLAMNNFTDKVRTSLIEQGFKVKQVPWYRDAFILENKSKRELMETEEYTSGKIYLQSLASMVPPLVLDPKPGEKVLDLTAAPGSKTSQIAALIQQQGELVANDNNRPRFFKLKHNMEFLGVADERAEWKFTLRLEDGWKLCGEFPEYFDKILLDAPCSAEARFIEGQPKTYGYWSERKIKEMAYKQRKLLLSAWGALKRGGILVYSTCTFAPEENEWQISRLLERFGAEVEVLSGSVPQLKTIQPVTEWRGKLTHQAVGKAIRLVPTKEIEGFFVAKIHKRAI